MFSPEKQTEILRLAEELHRVSKERETFYVANRAILEGVKNKAFRLVNNQHIALRASVRRAEFVLCDAIQKAVL
jgi:hypothetical protein